MTLSVLQGREQEAAFLAFRRHQEGLCDLLIKLLYGFVKEEIGDMTIDTSVANKSVLENPLYRYLPWSIAYEWFVGQGRDTK